MSDTNQNKRQRKKAQNPFLSSSSDLIDIVTNIELMVKKFSDKDQKDPNYKVFLKVAREEFERALDPKSRQEHVPVKKSQKIIYFINFILNNTVILVILCIILGALIGNVELLKTILSFIKG